VLSDIESNPAFDGQMREWLRTCENCSPRMSWASAYAAFEQALEPGLPAARYRAVRRVAQAYAEVAGPHDALALATVALASARLGESAEALSAFAVLSEEELARSPTMVPALRAARAFALRDCGQRDPALAELERLAASAAAPDAPPSTVSLWREVEAALAK